MPWPTSQVTLSLDKYNSFVSTTINNQSFFLEKKWLTATNWQKHTPNRVLKWWCHKNQICEIMGFASIFWKSNIQEAYLPKTSIVGQIASEILAQLCSDDSIEILLILNWV